GGQRLRYWCAASSTGEEPYTMAMTLADVLGIDADFRILATDISTRVLAAAGAGRYNGQQLDTVPPALRSRYFTLVSETPGRTAEQRREAIWEVVPALRAHISYHRLNLAQPPYPMSGPFDAVFVRNVMIYFDQPVRQKLIHEVETLLSPNGFVVLGHAETLAGIDTTLRTLSPAVYAWKPQA
ncbi:MAG: CheR family methyltransferase, partial [Deltaproteobacteria bacterium]